MSLDVTRLVSDVVIGFHPQEKNCLETEADQDEMAKKVSEMMQALTNGQKSF